MIRTWSTGDPANNMSEDLLLEFGSIVRRHPWWQARAELTLALLSREGVHPPATILDAGCGWGVTLERLERRGYRVTGLDISRRALELLDRPDRTLIEADLTRPLPPDAGPYDAVLALDLIEHLDDDRAAIAQFARLVRPGGLVLVSVPALPELFSEFDTVQGHRRRYLPECLANVFEGSGLRVDPPLWWGAWMLPLLRRQRRGSHAHMTSPTDVYRRYLALPPWPGRLLLHLAYKVEQPQALAGKSRVGSSLLAIARHPPELHNGDGSKAP